MEFKLLIQQSGQNPEGKFLRIAHIGQGEYKNISYHSYLTENGMVSMDCKVDNALNIPVNAASFQVPYKLLQEIMKDIETCLVNIDKY